MIHLEKRKGVEKKISNWLQIPYTELSKVTDGIDNLYQRKVDGYIIKDVLSAIEVKELIAAFHRIDVSKAVHFLNEEGFICPRSFAEIQGGKEMDDEIFYNYLDNAEWFANFIVQQTHFKLKERIASVFSLLQNNIDVKVPVYTNGSKSQAFNYSTLRYIKPGSEGMHTHCGGMFRDIYPNFYKRLDHLIDFERQLGYYLMLQRPEKGGKLRLYEAEWSEYKLYEDDKGFIDKYGNIKTIEETNYQDMEVMPGDMLIFVESDFWHGVTPPEGDVHRITLGGFLGYSINREQIYVWC